MRASSAIIGTIVLPMFLSFNKIFNARVNAIVVEIPRGCSSNNALNSSNAGTWYSTSNLVRRAGT